MTLKVNGVTITDVNAVIDGEHIPLNRLNVDGVLVWQRQSSSVVAKPTVQTRTYTGAAQYAFNAGTGYTLSGSGTNAGTYSTTATLQPGYTWSDGTTAPYTASFTIGRKPISKPSVKTRTYNASTQYGFDSGTGYTVSGGHANAGTYTATATLNSNYKWSDGSTAAYTASFTIKKASFTGVYARLRQTEPSYVQFYIAGPAAAADKSFTVDWNLYNTNTGVSQPRASGTESITANSSGNLHKTTGTYNNKATSDYKYYGNWSFDGSTNFNAFSFKLAKASAKTIKRQTSSATNWTQLV